MTSPAYSYDSGESPVDWTITDRNRNDSHEFIQELFGARRDATSPRHLRAVPSQPPGPSVLPFDPVGHSSSLYVGRVAVLLIAIVAMLFMYFQDGVQAESVSPAVVSHVIQPGETLWELARDITPAGGDIRSSVALIRNANSMTSSDLVVGEVIVIPVHQ